VDFVCGCTHRDCTHRDCTHRGAVETMILCVITRARARANKCNLKSLHLFALARAGKKSYNAQN